MASTTPQFTIVGAGLSGALMAAYLGRTGYAVDLYEKRRDPRVGGTEAGRSINLALSTRGIHALEEVGVAQRVLTEAVPMRGRMIHAVSGELKLQPYGTEAHHHINSVSRGGLNIALLDACEQYAHVRLFFGAKCTGVDLGTNDLEMEDVGSGERRSVPAEIVIGSDGAFSAVRRQIQALDRFEYHQSYLSHGYKELTIPPLAGGGFAMDDRALHIWPRGGYMMIALPNADGSYTCTLFWPLEGPSSFAALKTPADIRRYFETEFPDAVPLMPTLVEDYQSNPTSSMVTVRCSPWHAGGRIVLIGDAAHAVVPFYGQGMNASFEDCSVLNECIAQRAPNWERVFSEYHARRREHTDALAELAIGNFLEMRDHVGSRMFLISKHAEKLLHRILGRWYTPLYMMVTFTRIPYAETVRRARRQKRAVAIAAGVLAMIALMLIGIALR